jgi:FAD/FMN-containing dehydrogenase
MRARSYEEAYRELAELFGERFRRKDPAGPGTSVSPTNTEEVALVAEVAQRHGLPLTLRGARTLSGPAEPAAGGSLRRRVGVSTSSVSSTSRTPRGAASSCCSKMR